MKEVTCNICGEIFESPDKAFATCPESEGWVCNDCCGDGDCERCQGGIEI